MSTVSLNKGILISAFLNYIEQAECFWQKIKLTPSFYREDHPVIIQGKRIYALAKTGQQEMFSQCLRVSDFVEEYFVRNSSVNWRVLDLGCGLGANSIPLLKKGCQVVAFDNSRDLLEKFDTTIQEFSPTIRSKILFKCEDITTIEKYHEEEAIFDAAICVDILPYIPPSKLRTVMKKIYNSLREGGFLIGTVFFSSTDQTRNHPLIEFQQKLGAHYYMGQGKQIAEKLLMFSGFEMLSLKTREDFPDMPNVPQVCMEFLAKKISLTSHYSLSKEN